MMNDSREDAKTRSGELNVEEVSAMVVDCAYRLHVEAGPGLLESVYEVVLARMLADRGLRVRRQVPVPIQLFGMQFDEGFRADLIVHDLVLVDESAKMDDDSFIEFADAEPFQFGLANGNKVKVVFAHFWEETSLRKKSPRSLTARKTRRSIICTCRN